VQHVDRFGNVQLSVSATDLGELFVSGRRVELARGDDRYYAVCVLTFADVASGELVVFQDSEQRLSVAINRGNAAELIDADPGNEVWLQFAP
jgi:S-adenosylmethionine hydrolase